MHLTLTPPNLAVQRTVRFWQSWLGMLAATLPAWLGLLVIAMAFPVVKGGKILFKGGLPVFGACSCCDGGGGGPGPCGTFGTCSLCDGGGHYTPRFYEVVVSGVPVGECCNDAHPPPGQSAECSDLNGVFTLSETTSCTWRYDDLNEPYAGGPPYFWGNTDCSGSPAPVYDTTTPFQGIRFYSTSMILTRLSGSMRFVAGQNGEIYATSTTHSTFGGSAPFRGLNESVDWCDESFSIDNGTDTTAVCGSGTGTATFTPCTD